MSLPNIVHGSEQVSFKTRTSQGNTPLGTKMVVEDGRTYRYGKSNNTPVVGHLQQAELWDVSKNGNQAVDTLAAGVFVLTGVGVTTTAMAVDELKDGFVWIDSAANLNPGWVIVSNTAIAAGAATGTITIGTSTVDAIAAAEQISFNKNIWADFLQGVGSQTAAIAGICVVVIANGSFGWLQTGGMVRALTTGTVLEGDIVVGSASTSGGVMPSAAFETDGPVVGNVVGDLASTEYASIFLTFDS